MKYKGKKMFTAWLMALVMILSTFATGNVLSVKAGEQDTRFNFSFGGGPINGTVEYKVNGEESWHNVGDMEPDDGGSRWVTDLKTGDTITIKVAAAEGYEVDNNLSIGKRGQGSMLSEAAFSEIIGPQGYTYTIAEAGEYEIEHIFSQSNGGDNPPNDDNHFVIYVGAAKVYDSEAEEKITVPEGALYEMEEGMHGTIVLKPLLDEELIELFLEPIRVEGYGTLEIDAGRMEQIDAQHHTEQDTNITIDVYGNEEDEGDPQNGYSIFSTDNAEVQFAWGNSRACVNVLGGILVNRLVVTDIQSFSVGIINEEEGIYERSNGISAVNNCGSYAEFQQAFVNIYGWNGFSNFETVRASDEADVNVDAYLIFKDVENMQVQTGGAFHLKNQDEENPTIIMPTNITSGYYVEIGEILEIDRDGRIQDCIKTVECEVGDHSDTEGRYRYFNDGGNEVSLESATKALWSLGYTFIDDGRDDVVTKGYFEINAGSGIVDTSYTDGGSYWFEAGTEIEFRLIPDRGCQYVPGTFAFNGETREEVVVPSEEPGVYTFVMPNNPIHVACTFEETSNTITIGEDSSIHGADITLPDGINGTAELVVENTKLTESQQTAFTEVAGNKNIGSTLDLCLNEVIDKIGSDDSWITPITDLDNPVTVTIELAEKDKGNANYAIIREHNNETTIIEATYNEEDGTLSFPTDGFSVYAVAYTKKESKLDTPVTVVEQGIYEAEADKNHIVAGLVIESSDKSQVEYSWYAAKDGGEWFMIKDWTLANEWLDWSPAESGDYVIVGKARSRGDDDTIVMNSTTYSYHPSIKGICQVPYEGEGGGYLIGIESYDDLKPGYTCEMLVLDCTLLMQGKDAWIYSTGRCGLVDNCLWTVWQPLYGYYWTLFRIYDINGNLVDQYCYGFENI